MTEWLTILELYSQRSSLAYLSGVIKSPWLNGLEDNFAYLLKYVYLQKVVSHVKASHGKLHIGVHFIPEEGCPVEPLQMQT